MMSLLGMTDSGHILLLTLCTDIWWQWIWAAYLRLIKENGIEPLSLADPNVNTVSTKESDTLTQSFCVKVQLITSQHWFMKWLGIKLFIFDGIWWVSSHVVPPEKKQYITIVVHMICELLGFIVITYWSVLFMSFSVISLTLGPSYGWLSTRLQ